MMKPAWPPAASTWAHGLVATVVVDVGHHHAGPFPGEDQGRRPTDAHGRAGDDGHLPLQGSHGGAQYRPCGSPAQPPTTFWGWEDSTARWPWSRERPAASGGLWPCGWPPRGRPWSGATWSPRPTASSAMSASPEPVPQRWPPSSTDTAGSTSWPMWPASASPGWSPTSPLRLTSALWPVAIAPEGPTAGR